MPDEYLPIHADVRQSRLISNEIESAINTVGKALVARTGLHERVIATEMIRAMHRWAAGVERFRAGEGPAIETMDTHVLQTLFGEIALELEARGLGVTYAVGVPVDEASHETLRLARGTSVGEVVP